MNNTIKGGSMVQVWDWQSNDDPDTTLASHGRVGYAVKKEPDESGVREGDLWKVVFFDGGDTAFHHIHEEWLTVVNNASDIRKVKDDGL